MNRLVVGTAFSLWIMFACLPMSAQAPLRVDLRDWGYKPPEDASSRFERQLSTQIISVGNNADIAVGFVTRERTGLVTRELPPLSFHVVRFTRSGKFLSQLTIPTSSWHENAIFYGSDNTLLIRTGMRLRLLSPNMELVAERDLPETRDTVLINWQIYPLPNRTGLLLYNYRKGDTSIALLNWNDLKPIKECPYSPHDRVLSVSNENVLSFHPSHAENPLLRVVEISKICGPSQFSYSWEGGGTKATLVGDDSLILAAQSSSISFVVRDKVRWAENFDKKSDLVTDNIQHNADAHLVAIAVKRVVGGNRLFDIGPKLKGGRIIVYEARTGKKVSEVSLHPASSPEFDFALSPAGGFLAIASDGFLEIVPVKGSE
jgi:hypothetical protein